MQKKQTPDKYCEYCGQKLERKRLPNGDLEYLIHFNRRKYCNRECMKRAFLKTDESKQMWGAAHSTARKINQLILNKTECELCGKKCTCHYSYDDEEGHHQVGQDVPRKKADKCEHYTEEKYNRDEMFVL